MSRARRLVTALLTTVLVVTGAVAFTPAAEPASAAVASAFDPGYIVSDSVFYNGASMSTAQIRTFLATKGAACVAGERACLKDYRETTRSWPAEPGLCSGYTGRASETSAEILQRVALSCGINPMVLMVMLEKENSLVTRTKPTARSYDAAMGFGCPDTAPCNTEYYGFFNQTYRAARQYKVYQASPQRYGYQAGRSNYIQYNPNASCGGSQVTIRNQATAALYIYTPYQPNAAALNNLYGTGDSCSAYGNRNFWRLFTDWFGNPQQGGFLVKTAASSTIYAVVGTTKHPVSDYSTYLAFSNLGPVVTMSDAQVASYKTGAVLNRFVRSPTTGQIFFVDANIKLHASTCALVADYGSACTSAVDLTDQQLGLLSNGPKLTNAYVTSEWKHFYVTGGMRREVFDTQSLVAAGLPTARVQLTESGIAKLPYGQPIIRGGTLVTNRATNVQGYYLNGTWSQVPTGLAAMPGFNARPRAALDNQSINKIPVGPILNGVVTRSGSPTRNLVTGSGLLQVKDTVLGRNAQSTLTLTAALFDASPRTSSQADAIAIKTATDPTVLVVTNGVASRVSRWDDLVDYFGGTAPPVYVVAPITVKSLSVGRPVIGPGSMVKAVGQSEIYLVDAGRRLVHVDSFSTMQALGVTTWSEVPAATIASYTKAPAAVLPFLTCGSSTRVAISGRTYAHSRTEAGNLLSTALSAATCSAFPAAAGQISGPVLVSGSGPVVYRVIAGKKHPVASWSSLVSMAGTDNPQIFAISDALLATVPTSTTVG